MGIMIQTIWNTAHGRILFDSVNMGYPISRVWVAHWEFIYIPLALIFRIFPSVNTILIIQSFVISLGVLPVYWLARDKFKNRIVGLIFGLSYLLYPALGNSNLADVHGIVFSISLLLFAFYFLQKRKYGIFALFGLLALSCREDVALILFMFGLYSIIIQKNRKIGITLCVVSASYFFLYLKILTIRQLLGMPPIKMPVTQGNHWSHFGSNSFFGLIFAILKNPIDTLRYISSAENLKYIIKIFAPVGFSSFFSPSTILLAFPTFAINLLSDWAPAKSIDTQYTATIIPFVFISAIYGSKNVLHFIQGHFNKRASGKNSLKFLVYILPSIILFLTAFSFIFKSNIFSAVTQKTSLRTRIIEEAIQKIPPESSLSADIYLGTHAAMRLKLYSFPDHFDDADYVLYNFYSKVVRLTSPGGYSFPSVLPLNRYSYAILKNQNYGLIYFKNGITVFKKGANYQKGLNILFVASQSLDQMTRNSPKIVHNDFEFLGYSNVFTVGKNNDILHASIYWKVNKRIDKYYQFIYFVNNQKSILNDFSYPTLGLYPTNKWPEGQVIRDEVYLKLPQNRGLKKYSISLLIEENKTEVLTNPEKLATPLFTVHAFDPDTLNKITH